MPIAYFSLTIKDHNHKVSTLFFILSFSFSMFLHIFFIGSLIVEFLFILYYTECSKIN